MFDELLTKLYASISDGFTATAARLDDSSTALGLLKKAVEDNKAELTAALASATSIEAVTKEISDFVTTAINNRLAAVGNISPEVVTSIVSLAAQLQTTQALTHLSELTDRVTALEMVKPIDVVNAINTTLKDTLAKMIEAIPNFAEIAKN